MQLAVRFKPSLFTRALDAAPSAGASTALPLLRVGERVRTFGLPWRPSRNSLLTPSWRMLPEVASSSTQLIYTLDRATAAGHARSTRWPAFLFLLKATSHTRTGRHGHPSEDRRKAHPSFGPAAAGRSPLQRRSTRAPFARSSSAFSSRLPCWRSRSSRGLTHAHGHTSGISLADVAVIGSPASRPPPHREAKGARRQGEEVERGGQAQHRRRWPARHVARSRSSSCSACRTRPSAKSAVDSLYLEITDLNSQIDDMRYAEMKSVSPRQRWS
jgi:hypothetical protein